MNDPDKARFRRAGSICGSRSRAHAIFLAAVLIALPQ